MKVIYEDMELESPDGSLWHLKVYENMVTDLDGKNVNAHSMARVLPLQERHELAIHEEKNKRIHELKGIIADKKLLDLDCTEEQYELSEILGY